MNYKIITKRDVVLQQCIWNFLLPAFIRELFKVEIYFYNLLN